MTIACVGITVLDRVFRVARLPDRGGKFVASDYFEVGGGPAATAAVAVSRLGHSVDFIGRAGHDSVAIAMNEEFQRYGVNTRDLRQFDSATSSFSAILVDDAGERMIINYQDKSLPTDPGWMKEIEFSRYHAVLCDVRWVEGAKYALEQAKQAGIPTVLDADITPDDISELVALADHVVFSEPGLEKFTQQHDPIEGLHIAKSRTNGKVHVTVGSKGCFWLENDILCHKDGFKVDVKDTTGAGDVFHGAFAVAIAEGMPTDQAVQFSSAVAALKCTRFGGRDGIPDRATVDHFLVRCAETVTN